VKRVVSGWGPDDEPTVLFENDPPTHCEFGDASSDEIWVTGESPAKFRVSEDPAAGPFQVEPPLGGSVCRLATYRPGAEVQIHSTQTVDYIIVISGQLTMVLANREIILDPGDVVVQLAAPHGWANRGSTDCVVAAILLTAEGASEQEQIQWP
jgi:quercetin dioxygenase-like cupin family protein